MTDPKMERKNRPKMVRGGCSPGNSVLGSSPGAPLPRSRRHFGIQEHFVIQEHSVNQT